MGQMGSCACDNILLGESDHSQAVIEAKPGKKKHEITKIRNRINSVINPLKLPKFEQLAVTMATPRLASNRQPRKGQTLRLISEDPQRGMTLQVPANSTGAVCFQVGTDEDISEAYRVEVCEEKDEFRLSIKYYETMSNDGREETAFFLKDQGVGLGCFARIRPEERIPITNGMLISIGNEFIVPCFIDGVDSSRQGNEKTLEVKLYGGYAKGQVLDLDCGEQDCIVNVGRARHCRLVINDPILSKIQCRFVRKHSKWYLLDGSECDSSTNGTWVYLASPTRAAADLQIRCGSLYYRCQLEKNGMQ